MNIQRIRLLRTIFLVVVTWLGIQCCARAAYVGTVSTTNNLVFDINPNSANTNYYVVDQKALWLFDKGSSAVGTNALTSNFTGTGRWLWQWTGGNGGGSDLWTSFGTFIAPTFATNSFQITNLGYDKLNDLYLVSTQNPANSTQASGSYDVYQYTNRVSAISSVTSNSISWQIGQDVNPSDGLGANKLYQVFTAENVQVGRFQPAVDDGAGNTAWVFGTVNPLAAGYIAEFQNNGTNWISVGPTAQLTFGPGTTNVLYRSGSNQLVYSNGVPVFRVLEGVTSADIGVQSGIPYVSGTSYLELIGGAANLTLDGVVSPHALYGSVPIDLGIAAYPFDSLYLTNQIVWGPGATNVLYRNGSDSLVYTNSAGVALTIANPSGYTGSGTNWFGDDGKFHSTTFNTNGGNVAGTFTVPYYPRASGVNTLTDGALYASGADVALDGQFIWGPGTTNVLYRSGSDLVYTNGAANVSLVLTNGGGGFAGLKALAGDIAAVQGSNGVDVAWSTNTVRSWNHFVQPLQTGTDLGGDNTTSPAMPFRNVNLYGNAYIWGMITNGGDYSRLAISDDSASGIAVFDFQNAGTGTPWTKFSFRSNGVEVASLPGGGSGALYDVTNYFLAAGLNITIVTNVVGTNVTWTVTGSAGGGGGTVGTMVNTGIPVTNAVPVALDATGTNWGPSKMTFVQSDTNDLRQVWDAPAGMTATYEFRHVPSYATDGGGSYIDDIFQTGFNPQQTANNIKFYTQFESHYRINGTSPFKSEYHHDWRSTNNLLVIQPFGYEVVHTNGAVTGFFNGLWGWNDSYGNQEFKKTESGTLSFVGGDQVIAFDTNNSVVLRMNGTNGLAQNLPYVDAGNDLVISQPLVATGNQLTITNSDIRMDNGRVLSWVGNTGTKRTILYMGGTTVTLDNPEGNLIINKLPYFVSGGAWASARGTLSINTSAVGNLGSSATNLMTYTLPASVMGGTGVGLINTCAGTFAANSNNKQIQVYLNTDLLFDTGTIAANGGAWRLTTEIIRTGASSQVASTSFTCSSTLLPGSASWGTGAAPMTAATNVFKVVVTAAADNDVVQRLMRNEVAGGN